MANLADLEDESIAVLAIAEEEDKDETSPENKNLALDMDDEELNKISQKVVESYKEDLKSRSSWIEKVAKWRKLYFQEDKPINPPWQGSSEESVPVLTEAVNQFRARSTRVMFPGGDVVAAIPTAEVSTKDIERADRISKHMSWQITVQDQNYKKNMKRLTSLTALDGSFFRKIYRDPAHKKNVSKNVPARFLIVPYGDGPRDVEDLNRKTEIIHISTNETRKMAKKKYLTKPAKPWLRDSYEDDVKDAIDEAVGLDEPTDNDISGMSVLMEWHGFLNLDKKDNNKNKDEDDDIDLPYLVVLDAETEEILRIAQRWAEDDEDKEPIEFYEHYYFLENPDGFYGLGFGFILEQLNSAINRILRQSINAATLKNTAGGFIDEALGVQKGEIRYTMGQFKKVSANGRDLREGILAMNQYFPGADPNLIALIEKMIDYAQKLAMTSDALTGQVDKVMQPTTILALIEQGLQQFTAAQENILDAWTGELRKLYRLNSLYLDEQEYFAVLDDKGVPQQQQVWREDYRPDLQVTPTADPSMATQQQKIAKAQALMQVLTAALELGLPYSQREVIEHFKRYYEAFEFKDISSLLPVSEEPRQREDNPLVEQFYVLLPSGKMPGVFYDQDHNKHFEEHIAFINDPEYGPRISLEGRKQLETHIRTHVACMYGQNEAGIQELKDEEILDTAQAEALTPPPPQQAGGALQQLAGQNSQDAMGPNPEQQANMSQEDLGEAMGG